MDIKGYQLSSIAPMNTMQNSVHSSSQTKATYTLSADRVTLNGVMTEVAPTYSKSGLMRSSPQKSLTELAWEYAIANRVGLDKNKLDEIEQKIKDVSGNTSLSEEERQRQLEDLYKQKEELIKKSAEMRSAQGDEDKEKSSATI